MKILDQVPLTEEELDSLRIAAKIDAMRLPHLRRREVLMGIAATTGGIILPTAVQISDRSDAQVYALISVIISGAIRLLKEVFNHGDLIEAQFDLVNSELAKASGYLNTYIEKDFVGIRDTMHYPLELGPKTRTTIGDNNFFANADYGTGHFEYQAETSLSKKTAGLQIISTTSVL